MNRKLLFSLFCGLFLTLTINAQNPVALFKATVLSGCSPLVDSFTNQSTGVGPLSYSWNFGPTVSPPLSNAVNPIAVFTVAGKYNVTLTVKDANGVTSTSQPVVINVLPTPIANFDATIITGCFPLTDQFQDKSTPGSLNATLVKWKWSFGDGSTMSGTDPAVDQNPFHTYYSAGLPPNYGFPVTLQVFNSSGCSGSTGFKTNSGYITVANGVKANFVDSLSASCKPRAYFTNISSGGAPGLTYLWEFGDGSTSTSFSPNYAYANPGSYNIYLTVSSSAGCVDSIKKTLIIPVGSVQSKISGPVSACIGVPVTFTNTSTPNPLSSTWDFGNGSNSNQIDPPPTSYPALGTYIVTLANKFAACNDTTTKTIQIVNAATANFIALGSTTSCNAPLAVSFQDQSTGAPTVWAWDFGDKTPLSSQQNPTHTYTTYGIFDVTLTVSSGSGCNGFIKKSQFVKVTKPFVQITNLPAFGCGSINFTPAYIDTVVDGIASYFWNFDNGNTYTVANPPTQTYLPGGYKVSLTIKSNGGCTATYSDSVKVGTIKPVPAFTAFPLTVCTGQGVNFKDQSTGSPNQWSWDFGDGIILAGSNPAVDQNPSHGYSTPGKYSVKLIAYNKGCGDSVTILNYITVIGPVSKFGYTFNCANQNQYIFSDSSIGPITQWSWNFGDGSTLTGSNPAIDQNPIHTYAGPGVDTVVLIVTGAAGCTSVSSQVIISNQKYNFKPLINPICKNVGEPFSTTNYGSIRYYHFDFGDGTTNGADSLDASPIHPYSKAGLYTVTLNVVYLNGCTDSKTSTVLVNGPTAGFSASNLFGCQNVTTQFTDASTTDGTHGIVSRLWDFSDGFPLKGNNPTPSHTYTTQGIYNVQLTVGDAAGCFDSSTQRNLVTVSVPQAQFSGSDSSCPGSAIQFNNTSQGGFNPSFAWNFNNGNTYTVANPPAQSYPAVGTYLATLNMSDMYGCVSPAYSKTITIGSPFASFTVDASTSSCPPLIVDFKYTGGNYYSAIQWQFGDGGVNNDSLTVSNYYTKPGVDTARLIVTSPGGCTSDATQVITIFGPTGKLSYSPLEGCDSVIVNLNVVSSGVTDYIWIFGDTSNSPTTTLPSISHTYYPPLAGQAPGYLPGVILQAPNGTETCSVAQFGDGAPDSVRAIGIKPKFGIDKYLLCANGNIQFSDSSKTNDVITNYFWDFGDNKTLSGMSPNPSHFYTLPGLYYVKLVVSTKFGCQDSITQPNPIKVVANPVIGITGANSQCVPATLNFGGVVMVPDTSALTWAWNFFNHPPSAQQNPPAQVYALSGNDSVRLIVTNSSGCLDTVSQNFTIFPLPSIIATADTTICVGQSLLLNAGGGVSYSWLPPSNSSLSCSNCANPLARPTITTSYVVIGTSALGCQASDTLVVTVNQPVTVNVIPASDSVCIGRSVQLTAGGAALYAWTPAAGLSNPGIANPRANPTATTLYQVIGSDNKYCFSDTQFVSVTVFNYPTLNLGADVTIPSGSSYQITGNGSPDIISVNWMPVTGLSCTNCLSPLASPQNTTTYIATVVNNGGCPLSDSIKITVVCTDNNFFVPNTFSPNGDGVNDVFYVRGKGLNIIPSMIIFNRWGQIVFEKRDFAPNDPSAGWDGNFNGKKAPADVYVYTIQVICDNSTLIPYHGNVTLIR